MTDILAALNAAKVAAMKAKANGQDTQLKLDTLRGAIGEIERDSKEKKPRGPLAVLKGEVSKRRATAEIYENAGEHKRAVRENSEGDILQDFLPKEPTELELQYFIADYVGANGLEGAGNKAMGQVMAVLKEEFESFDGKTASALARKILA